MGSCSSQQGIVPARQLCNSPVATWWQGLSQGCAGAAASAQAPLLHATGHGVPVGRQQGAANLCGQPPALFPWGGLGRPRGVCVFGDFQHAVYTGTPILPTFGLTHQPPHFACATPKSAVPDLPTALLLPWMRLQGTACHTFRLHQSGPAACCLPVATGALAGHRTADVCVRRTALRLWQLPIASPACCQSPEFFAALAKGGRVTDVFSYPNTGWLSIIWPAHRQSPRCGGARCRRRQAAFRALVAAAAAAAPWSQLRGSWARRHPRAAGHAESWHPSSAGTTTETYAVHQTCQCWHQRRHCRRRPAAAAAALARCWHRGLARRAPRRRRARACASWRARVHATRYRRVPRCRPPAAAGSASRPPAAPQRPCAAQTG
mmetsp:Transcript_14225/g.41451  ORF Transcript_14225/g.41451 Transcript_14225/m.41451 type:complete len:377 (+) Transcript_14225:119-1249(+)